MMKKKYDVIVVGAGPAGCSASYFIARRGYEVLLIDKAKFPRDKACGDAISALALDVLDRMDVSGKIEDINPQRIDDVAISSPAGEIVRCKIPSADGLRDYGYTIPRKEFDFLLLEHVKGISNVSVLENLEVKDLIYDEKGICGISGRYEKQLVEFTCRFIVGADGAHSIIAKRLHTQNNDPKHRAFALRAYFENVEGLDKCIEIHYEESILPGYGWIFDIGNGKANVGIGIFNRFMSSKGIKNLFMKFIEENRYAKEKLKKAHMIENSLKGWLLPFGSFPSKRSAENVMVIGDAGSFVDPITGEGIYYALKSGEYVSQAISAGPVNADNSDTVGDMYEKLWRRGFRWRESRPAGQGILRNFELSPAERMK